MFSRRKADGSARSRLEADDENDVYYLFILCAGFCLRMSKNLPTFAEKSENNRQGLPRLEFSPKFKFDNNAF